MGSNPMKNDIDLPVDRLHRTNPTFVFNMTISYLLSPFIYFFLSYTCIAVTGCCWCVFGDLKNN